MGLLRVGSEDEATGKSAGGNLPVEVDAVVRLRDFDGARSLRGGRLSAAVV
jgi:hypothetical protein